MILKYQQYDSNERAIGDNVCRKNVEFIEPFHRNLLFPVMFCSEKQKEIFNNNNKIY